MELSLRGGVTSVFELGRLEHKLGVLHCFERYPQFAELLLCHLEGVQGDVGWGGMKASSMDSPHSRWSTEMSCWTMSALEVRCAPR